MPTLRLDLEYDGTGFRGWARQPGLRTVQGELEAALAQILREEIHLTVAGRTDSGVHARGQVASFRTAAEPPPNLARRLNGVGPRDLAVKGATVVDDAFDARGDASSRSYAYRLETRPSPSPFERGRALWWPHRVDLAALEACAAALLGTHDFTAFTPTQTDHVRFRREVLAASWTRESGHRAVDEPVGGGAPGEILAFRITADAFMRNMVRALVGTMLEVASSRRTVENFNSLLEGAQRRDGGESAPPHGLYLESVSYE
jgi:tRNA pseudouridine38-40 synthase